VVSLSRIVRQVSDTVVRDEAYVCAAEAILLVRSARRQRIRAKWFNILRHARQL
jgi:hypothetical protein